MFITGLMLGGSLTWLICKNAEAEVLGNKLEKKIIQ